MSALSLRSLRGSKLAWEVVKVLGKLLNLHGTLLEMRGCHSQLTTLKPEEVSLTVYVDIIFILKNKKNIFLFQLKFKSYGPLMPYAFILSKCYLPSNYQKAEGKMVFFVRSEKKSETFYEDPIQTFLFIMKTHQLISLISYNFAYQY